MDNVDKERKLQDRVVSWLEKDLGYTYMGNLEDQDNKAIKSNLLEDYLRRRGYTATQIKQAIMHLEKPRITRPIPCIRSIRMYTRFFATACRG